MMLSMKKHIIPNVSYTRLETHELLLRDTVRTEHYKTAIEKIIMPNDIVLDLGTGTGILAFFACQAGAYHVYAVEREQIIELASLIAKHNGYHDRIEFIRADSNNIDIHEKVDVLVSECLGSFGLNTMMLNDFFRVRNRLLKPHGKTIPNSMSLFVSPFASDTILSEMNFWKNSRYGVDFSPIGTTYTGNQVYVINLDDCKLLALPQSVHHINFISDNNVECSCRTSFDINSPGKMVGICGWFNVELAPNIQLSTSPNLPPTSWYQVMFPLHVPLDVIPGDLLSLYLVNKYYPELIEWKWTISISRMGEQIFHEAHHSQEGFPKSSRGRIPSHYPSF